MKQDNLRIWLDDIRPMPSYFNIHIKTADEAIKLLETGKVRSISLDHDLGDYQKTGYDVAKYIEEAAFNGKLKRIVVFLHTDNPVGKSNMRMAILNAERYWEK